MKVPVMLALFEAISRGELKLEQPVLVKNEFVSISDQSVYSLESREDSDPKLYDLIGQQRPLSELMQRMIVRSSNLSTNILIDLIGAPKVMSLMGTLGANDIRVLRGVEDDKAYKAGMNNTTTASDLLLVLRAVAEEKAITPAASQAMIKIMLAQEFNEGIPAGVPAGTRVAHKTGSITSVYHDAAIVYPPDRRPYILVVLTWGWKDKRQAEAAVRRISRAAWLESVASNQ